MLEDVYGSYDPSTEDNTVTIKFDCDKLAEDGGKLSLFLQAHIHTNTHTHTEVVVDKVANLKRNLFGAPFDSCFHALKTDGVKLGAISYDYRKDGTLFLCPGNGNVAVIFQLYYKDDTDQELAKILLNEFTEVQRS